MVRKVDGGALATQAGHHLEYRAKLGKVFGENGRVVHEVGHVFANDGRDGFQLLVAET